MTPPNITPKPADRIVFKRQDGQYDVEDGTRAKRSTGLQFQTAYEIARVGASDNGGRLLWAHYSKPDSVTLDNPMRAETADDDDASMESDG